jgi:hypothetical protein
VEARNVHVSETYRRDSPVVRRNSEIDRAQNGDTDQLGETEVWKSTDEDPRARQLLSVILDCYRTL